MDAPGFVKWLEGKLYENKVDISAVILQNSYKSEPFATTVETVVATMKQYIRIGDFDNEDDRYDENYEMFDTLTEELQNTEFTNTVEFLARVAEAMAYAGFIKHRYLSLVTA